MMQSVHRPSAVVIECSFRFPRRTGDRRSADVVDRQSGGRRWVDVPAPFDAATRARMQKQRRRDTRCEVEVRRELHRRGRGFRVDVKLEDDMRCRADLAWKTRKIAVFIDGCFWHGCPVHGTSPKNNAVWWASKIETNCRRDGRITEELSNRGWRVLRF